MGFLSSGGGGGIRTPGTLKRTIDFESTALDHSATSPMQIKNIEVLFAGMWQNIAKTKIAKTILQSLRFLQILVHKFLQVLTIFYANIREKLNQVFTPTHFFNAKIITQETFEFLKNA